MLHGYASRRAAVAARGVWRLRFNGVHYHVAAVVALVGRVSRGLVAQLVQPVFIPCPVSPVVVVHGGAECVELWPAAGNYNVLVVVGEYADRARCVVERNVESGFVTVISLSVSFISVFCRLLEASAIDVRCSAWASRAAARRPARSQPWPTVRLRAG